MRIYLNQLINKHVDLYKPSAPLKKLSEARLWHFCQISPRSDLERRSPRLFWRGCLN